MTKLIEAPPKAAELGIKIRPSFAVGSGANGWPHDEPPLPKSLEDYLTGALDPDEPPPPADGPEHLERIDDGHEQAARQPETPPLQPEAPARLILSSAEFVGGFVPPDYLVDGLLQRGFVYSFTGKTGHGKTTVALRVAAHAALAEPLDSREIERQRVLFFAGENPDDIRMRWIKLCEEMGQDPDDLDVWFMPGTPTLKNEEIRKKIYAEAKLIGPFGLLIVDTSAAYFQGDDENNNTQLHAHAKMLRGFTSLPGRPTVIVTCHPTKNPDMDNLLPRGGGAFLNEMDGNLVAINRNSVVTVTWHGKFRGPDFPPVLFKLTTGTSEKVKDSKGRPVWTVTATPISEKEKAGLEETARQRQDEMLVLLKTEGRMSLTDMAARLEWWTKAGEPNKTQAHRTLNALIDDELVERKRSGKLELTQAGKAAVNDIKNDP